MFSLLCIVTMMSEIIISEGLTGAVNFTENPAENEASSTYQFPFVTRSQWNAREAKNNTILSTPVPYVVIHHSFIPSACYTYSECCRAMKSMQDFHVDDRGWWDVGYNFAVGSDGSAYEGRGWQSMGAHALHFNTVSIGICIIGDWQVTLPPQKQLQTVKELIQVGVEKGYIQANYKLVGHRQVRDTECPGGALHEEIKNWKHFSKFPASVHDLESVPELRN